MVQIEIGIEMEIGKKDRSLEEKRISTTEEGIERERKRNEIEGGERN